MVEITAQTKEGASVAFDYDLGGEELSQLVARFGESVVASFAYRAIVIAVQAHARGLIKSGKSDAEIAAAMAEWNPGTPRQVTSAYDKASALLDKLTPEQRKQLMQDLKANKQAA